jgi:hypothetical protein
MKKNILLILLLLAGCQAQWIGMEAFEFSGQCPQICWMGINPGATTLDDAVSILNSSNQIDQEQISISGDNIFATWNARSIIDFTSGIEITSDNGLVRSISLMSLSFTMGDFVNLLGEPDVINIQQDTNSDNMEFITYSVYYSASKTMITVNIYNNNGPDSTDRISTLILNIELINWTPFPEQGEFQPWLGYGHLQDYLPGVDIPAILNPVEP